jgi:isopenicillin-N N-acyltransferase-like protein
MSLLTTAGFPLDPGTARRQLAHGLWAGLVLMAVAAGSARAAGETAVADAAPPIARDRIVIARCGEGFLEDVGGHLVLHVAGSPYQMGFQHGRLLRERVHAVARYLLDVKAKDMTMEWAGVKVASPQMIIQGIQLLQQRFIPDWYHEELRGVADGSGVPLADIRVCNFIPELFHCSGFALSGNATVDGITYHGRVLDYGCDWRLQEHPVLLVGRPDGKIPFVNVTYAGFIGSVTGMNAERISVGEMGGAGLGKWQGVPMAILMREVLHGASTLADAVAVFRDHPRTCEYFYVIADGKTGEAVGMEAGADVFRTVSMGQAAERLPHAVDDAVLLSAGDRYELLVERVRAAHGAIDAAAAIALMDRPVSMKSNLHNVLFETSTGRFWVAHASKEGEPAAEQGYRGFDLRELLAHEPGDEAPELPGPIAEPAAVEPAAVPPRESRESGGPASPRISRPRTTVAYTTAPTASAEAVETAGR